MCGIAGVVGTRDSGLIHRMTTALRHRGPDGTGHCSRSAAHVGATRLSIIDPAASAQPVYNETGQICVVFNGEIYNHQELRADLVRKGHVFRTRTDTETIVHLYEEMGDDCVHRLRGMFAFAVLDAADDARLFLARDRLGIKPLYYTRLAEEGIFLFASEIKALLQYPGLTPRLDVQALADSVALGHLVGDATFFEGVRSLCPGHTLVVQCGDEARVEAPRPYFAREVARDPGLGFEEAEAALGTALERAVETHLAADVEVGLTLSGGIDSAVLAFLAAPRLDRPLRTFTLADHDDHPDILQAAQVARAVGAEHRQIVVKLDDYLAAIPALIATEEQPTRLYGLPFYLLCREVAREVKACLHGEGADELFGGYREYGSKEARIAPIVQRLPRLKQLGVAPSEQALVTIRRLSSARGFDEYLQRIFEVNMGDPLERQHLVPVDKCAMAASLEMRVPYLDDGVIDLVARMPLRFLVRSDLGVKKYILRRLALKRFGPEIIDVVLREKLGAPASGVVLLDRFDQMCDETLPDDYLARHSYGCCFTSKRELLLFDMFLEIFMKHRGDTSAIGDVTSFMRSRS